MTGPDLTLIAAAALRDAWREGYRAYWIDRARDFEDARPSHTDSYGRAAIADVVAASERLAEQAQACRNRATLLDGAADVELAEAAADIGRQADPSITRDDVSLAIAQEQLARALAADDHAAVDRLEWVIDQLAPPAKTAAA